MGEVQPKIPSGHVSPTPPQSAGGAQAAGAVEIAGPVEGLPAAAAPAAPPLELPPVIAGVPPPLAALPATDGLPGVSDDLLQALAPKNTTATTVAPIAEIVPICLAISASSALHEAWTYHVARHSPQFKEPTELASTSLTIRDYLPSTALGAALGALS